MINRYRLLITGKNPDYFIHQLMKRKIFIYDLKKEGRAFYVTVDAIGLEEIKTIKTIYKYKIVDRFGLAKAKYLLRKYAIFLGCVGFGILLNIFLSMLIFDVEVIHSNPSIQELIYQDLKEEGISRFHFKVSFEEKEKIVQRILKKETNDIEWLEIEEKGTKYEVKVEQRKKNQPEKECTAQNIIAKKDAMILEIQAESGEVLKKKMDAVKKGDVLISGLIYNKETVVSKRCATGKVFGEVWYQIHLELPKKYHEERVTGNEKNQIEIQFLNSSYTLFHNFEHYQKESYTIVSSPIFPIRINFSKYLETKVKDKTYTLSNVNKAALTLAENKLKTRLGREDEILSKNVLKKTEKDSKIIVEVFIKVKEDITDTEDITDLKIEELNQEKESKE